MTTLLCIHLLLMFLDILFLEWNCIGTTSLIGLRGTFKDKSFSVTGDLQLVELGDKCVTESDRKYQCAVADVT